MSEESKHTPAPWTLATSCSWRRFVGPRGELVCEPIVQHGDNHPDLHFRNGGPDGPDARLIAASPDTYDVTLKANAFAALVIQWMRGGSLDAGKHDILLADARELAAASMAALARVHGEAEEDRGSNGGR